MDTQKMNELASDVKDIKDAILGEGTHKNNGVLDRISRNETRITALEKFFWTAIGGGSLLIIILQLL
jgi:hypothetical protein